jgi:hypothetical protein
MSEITLVKIIRNKEKRELINIIKNLGLNNKGIIFGGVVRNDIIGCHYRKEFFKNTNNNYKDYWKNDYDIETIKRITTPNDLDIYFNDEKYVTIFINKITTLVNSFNGRINIINNDNTNLKYIVNNLTLKHTKVYIELNIGRTIKFSGIKLKFNIDIIYNKDKNTSNNIEPPFFNLDFLSNIFIMEKINGINNIRISNCTGTPIDSMTYLDKAKITYNIMNDIINGVTSFVGTLNVYYAESINCYRIIKMILNNWNIINLPFKIISKNNIDYKHELCCICQESIEYDQDNTNKIFQINTNIKKSYYLHYDCFMNYLILEQKKNNINKDSGEIECKCPLRNPFNFKECHKLVKYE